MIMDKLKQQVNPEVNRPLTIENYGKSAKQEESESLLEETDRIYNIELDINMEITPEEKRKKELRNFKFWNAFNQKKIEKKPSNATVIYKKSYPTINKNNKN